MNTNELVEETVEQPAFYCPYELSIETLKCIDRMDAKLPKELLDAIYE